MTCTLRALHGLDVEQQLAVEREAALGGEARVAQADRGHAENDQPFRQAMEQDASAAHRGLQQVTWPAAWTAAGPDFARAARRGQ
jgi:hypothetical protein